MENDFLNKITKVIEDNISNEQFGVSELADEIGMSRSNLLRKVKKLSNISVSQFIREVRLRHALELLQNSSSNVSEVSYNVGFSSPSYFIKCFREFYGYPPGEHGKNNTNQEEQITTGQPAYSHQLAAIMFTDIQGYTALMQKDEGKAVKFRARHREVFNPITQKFKGKILQYYGDGTLSTFNSAIDAVRCGIELQLAFREELQIPVRIGIHSGDIIFTEDDIIGDGVNVASRIESLAAAQSVFISDKVYDEVKNQSGIQTVSMGTFELLNVDKPIEVFAISNPGLVVPERDQIQGKVKKDSQAGNAEAKSKKNKLWMALAILVPLIIVATYLIFAMGFFNNKSKEIPIADQSLSKKSIAVLPFLNDSDDSTNVYFVNGLMESILNNLQNIEDLRVISRTSSEKYRNTNKTIPEIAEELDVTYFVEGSGQKIGDKVLLHIQLIEALSDKHLLSLQYNREINHIFDLQLEVAKKIVEEIEVIVTPEEEERINKIPTDNVVAYDHFLKGLDYAHKGNKEGLEEAISWYEKAIGEDNEFALAYANIGISYYYLDFMLAEKKNLDLINEYADKALLYDPKLPQSLMAKAFYHMNSDEKEKALPYLEKALEYNPNSALVINTLSDYYTSFVPNTGKYLEYALMGIQLDIGAQDSSMASFSYLHISNALIQSGFVDEAREYIKNSLDYNPHNLYSEYVKAYIQYAEDRDLVGLKNKLTIALRKDTSRLDILQEVGKAHYYLRDYEKSYFYYKKLVDARKAYQLDVYAWEDAKISLVYAEVGQQDKSDELFNAYKIYAKNDNSIYKLMSQAMVDSYSGDTENAIKNLKLFSEQDDYFYWILLFLEMDPLVDNIRDLPEFKECIKAIETNFWERHRKLKVLLEEKELI